MLLSALTKAQNLMEIHNTDDLLKCFLKDLKWGGSPLFLRGFLPFFCKQSLINIRHTSLVWSVFCVMK